MDRRETLKLLGKMALLATPFSSKIITALTEEKTPEPRKWVLIYDSFSFSSFRRDELLEKAAPYLATQDVNWMEKLVSWDIRSNGKEITAFTSRYGKNTRSFSWPILIAVPDSSHATTEVETWTIDWLEMKNRAFTDACYPISGGWWSVDGDWNPSIKKVRDHLFHSSNHTGGHFQKEWLELLKFEELQSVHSDHHREMVHEGKVAWKKVNAECNAGCTPQPIPYTGDDRTIRLGESTRLGGMPISDQKYEWTPGNTLDEPTSSSPLATPLKDTTYTLKAQTICGTTSKTVKVTVVD